MLKSAPYFLEILDKRVNKGTGVKSLADVLGIKPEEIMAIGDQENDIAMIEYAGVGVAMDNAIPSVKEVANFVTKSNLEDGVAFAIERCAELISGRANSINAFARLLIIGFTAYTTRNCSGAVMMSSVTVTGSNAAETPSGMPLGE